MADRSHLSIGEVLSLLRDEFPDVTISKIRFLESQGLVDPERTPSGYRKFYEPDVERLRWILRQQREHYMPLKVIRSRLTESPAEPVAVLAEPATVGGRPAVDTASVVAASEVDQTAEPGRASAGPGPLEADGLFASPAGADHESAPEEPASSPALDGGAAATVQAGAPASSPRSTPSLFAGLRPDDASSTSDRRSMPSRSGGAARTSPIRSESDPGSVGERDGVLGAEPEPDPTPAVTAPPEANIERPPTTPPGGRSRPPRPSPAAASPVVVDDEPETFTAEELAAAAGADPELIGELKQYGLIAPHAAVAGTQYYDDSALAVARAAADFSRYGVEARHLRIWRNAADREADLLQQLVLPLLRQRNPQARRQALETLADLSRAGADLRAALVERAIRDIR